MDLYRILGVNRDASEKEIKKAYRTLSKKYHPDKNNGKESSEFIQIVLAYKILTNTKRRKKYDETGDISESLNKDREVIKNIIGMLNTIIVNRGIDLKHTDIFKIMKNTIEKEQNKMNGEINNINTLVDRYNIVRDRIYGKDKLLLYCIDDQIANYEKNKRILKKAKEQGNDMKKFIEKYKYKIDEMMQIHNVYDVGGGTTSTTTFGSTIT